MFKYIDWSNHPVFTKRLLWAKPYPRCYGEYKNEKHLKLPFRVYDVWSIR